MPSPGTVLPRLSAGRIEMDSPHVEDAATARNEVNHLSIGRPARLVVPMLAIRDLSPRSARRECHVESGLERRSVQSFKDNPSAIRREVWLEEITGWVGKNLSRRFFRMRGVGHGQQPDFHSAGYRYFLRHQKQFTIGGPIVHGLRVRAWCCDRLFAVALAGPDHKLPPVLLLLPVFYPVIREPRAVGRPLRKLTYVIVSQNWGLAAIH